MTSPVELIDYYQEVNEDLLRVYEIIFFHKIAYKHFYFSTNFLQNIRFLDYFGYPIHLLFCH